jgi:signal transduction histidine kinase
MTNRRVEEGRGVAVPEADRAREREIERYGLLHSPAGRDLQAVVELAAQVFGVSGAAINLITGTAQHQIAAVGVEPSVCSRDDSMCAVVISEPEPVLVTDASLDPRFARNPFVAGPIGAVRFYASAPLLTREGVPLGRLCVFDEAPREPSPRQSETLTVLAERVMDVLELRLQSSRLEASLEELTRTRDELRRSNDALEGFASQVSHDLRNPLMVISANAEMLSGEPAVGSDPDLLTMVDDIRDASRRMSRLIAESLAHAREGGRPRPGTADLGAVFDQALLDLRPSVLASRARVVVDQLPTVPGDPDLLYSVALNLLTNGLKFTHPGVPPRVRVDAERRGSVWRIRVTDEGIGVAAEDRESVFLPFVRAVGTDGVAGHGIGLATVKRVVEAHDGAVGLESGRGAGTTVWFQLPAEQCEAQPAS